MKAISKFAAVLLAIAPVFFSAMVLADPVPITPGEYELTIATSIRGEAPRPDKYTRCIKETDLENVEAIFNTRFFAGFKADPTCKADAVTMAAGKISYNAECQKQTVRVEGRTTAKNFSVRRVAKAKAVNGLGADSRIDGKLLGECK
ncbi:MAG: DUF3617 family protein [Betaproteobacteria bacterium]